MTKKISKRQVEGIIDRLMYESIIERGGDDVDRAYKIVASTFKRIPLSKPKKKKDLTHKDIHIQLHRSLDQLAADFMRHTQQLPSKTSVMDLMKWASEQAKNPSELSD